MAINNTIIKRETHSYYCNKYHQLVKVVYSAFMTLSNTSLVKVAYTVFIVIYNTSW